MAILTSIAPTWTQVGPLASAEIWQCTDGEVEVTVEATPAASDGIRLAGGRAVNISTGKTVRYRRVGDTAAVIRREAF